MRKASPFRKHRKTQDRFIPGDFNVIDDVTGFKIKGSETTKQWDGMRTAKAQRRHEQDFLRPIPDKSRPPWARPEPDENFVSARQGPFPQGAITASDVGVSSLTLSWNAAIDGVTAQTDLEYQVYQSLSDNINSIAAAEANGTVIQAYTANLLTLDVTGLAVETGHYFNVLVKTEDGTKAAYSSIFVKTLEPPLFSLLVASWDLDETSGARVDQSGNSFDLTDNNTVLSSTGVGAGQVAADFVSTNSEYLSVANDTALQIGNRDWTMNFWVNLDGTGTDNHILRKGDAGAGGIGDYQLSRGATGNVLNWRGKDAGGSNTPVVVIGSLSGGTWAMVTIGYNSGTENLFGALNTASLVTGSVPGGMLDGSDELWFGRSAGFGDLKIQAVRIWNRLLTDSERTALYNLGTAALLHDDLAGV